MTGWRLGWMVLPDGARDAVAEIVEVTHSGCPPFTAGRALAALADTAFVEPLPRALPARAGRWRPRGWPG